MASVCFGVALKLVKPADRLHVLHVQLPPGPLDLESLDTFKATTAPFYEDKLKRAEVQGCVDVVVNPSGDTIAEVIQQYLADVRAAFLVFGIRGEGAVTSATNRPSSSQSTKTSNQASSSPMKTQRPGNVAAALIASPRCTLVITKE
ncbi:NADH dehydrogenase Fe-S protein subunit 7 ndufs7 [Aphanomyces cochlioides]|nr:NADH dehydrogenase Fe-S protein subunit 7 ndufs7 [Aphanomyces cochlioides]